MSQRVRLIIIAHAVWLFVVCLLGAWWGRLLLAQAALIAELQGSVQSLEKVQRMLFWESPVFFGLLLISAAVLFWLYWSDLKKTRSIQAFFASMTHELRTPLTSIRLQAESIAETLGEDRNSEKSLLKRLLEDTQRLESQVERTLELSRLEGGSEIFIQVVEIKSWLDRFLKSWLPDHESKIQLSLDIQDLLIEADPSALQIIFRNLFENSIKHSKQERTSVKVYSRSVKSGWVSLIIEDQGVGFSENQQKLGTLFYKGAQSTGTGVGLYLIRSLMKKMGGHAHFVEAPPSQDGSLHQLTSQRQGFWVQLHFKEGK